ncbi:capsular polysaccharide biosynthesis protein [filamentous cyanobacterium Phorm 6]|nr:capsular polysaccharide biosynthesis protein [filamentous cyanobacterium Phorm 6]
MENKADIYSRGNVLYPQGELTDAETSYRQAIAREPNNPMAYYNLGVVLDERYLLEEAETNYRQAIVLKPDYVKAYSNLGCVLVKLDKLFEAIEVFRQAIALSPNWATLHNNLGQALQAQGKVGDALSAYIEAIRLQPDLVLAHYNAGQVWQSQGQHGSAGRCFEKVIELAPDNASAYSEWGYSLMAEGKLDAAMACFQKAISLQPTFVEAYCDMVLQTIQESSVEGKEIDELGQAKIACARFIQALQRQSNAPEVYANLWQTYVHLGNVLFEYGEFKQAEIYYHKALQIKPNDVDILGRVSHCLVKQKRLKAAVIVCHIARIIQPDAPSPYIKSVGTRQCRVPTCSKTFNKRYNSLPKGTLCAKNWVFTVQLNGARYISTLPESQSNAVSMLALQSQSNAVSMPALQGLLEMSIGVDSSELESNPVSNKLPDFDSSQPGCEGLNCTPCLKRIYQQFAPIYQGLGIHVFNNNLANISLDSPSNFVAVIPEGRAWIVPQKNSWMICNAIAIITPDNYLLTDISREYPGSLPGCMQHDTNKHRVFNLEELPILEQIDGTVAVLSGLSGNVYFHWMVDILPRLDILRQSKVDWEKIDGFLVNSIAQPFQRETLLMLGISPSKIIESDRHPHIQAKKLIVPSFSGSIGWLQPRALKFLRQEFLKQIPSPSSPYPERIYISRAKSRYRRVINEEEVMDYLAKFGFQSFVTESLSVVEQIALFYHAKIIVAPHGSGLTNIIFCRNGTKIIELLSPHYLRPYYCIISQLLGLEHYYLIGEVFACYPIRELMYQNPMTEDIKVSFSQLEEMMKIANIINPNSSVAKPTHKQTTINSETTAVQYPSVAQPTSMQTAINSETTVVQYPSVAQPTSMQTAINSETTVVQLHEQAEVYLTQRKLEEAEATCLQALNNQPKSAPIIKLLGNILHAKGKIEESRKCYITAIEIQPDFAAAYVNLGSLYAQQQQWDSAIKYYQQAIHIDPNLTAAYRNLAKVWTQLNKPTEAADCWYAALSLEPEKFSAQECVNLGNTLVRLDDITRGIYCYQRALELNPNLVGVYQNLGEAMKRQGKLESALVYYQKVIELTNNAADGWDLSSPKNGVHDSHESANVLDLSNPKNGVVDSHKSANVLDLSNPKNGVNDSHESANVLDLSSPKNGVHDSHKSSEPITSEDAEALIVLAGHYYNKGKLSEAIAQCQRAISLQPQAVGAYHILGEALQVSGKLEEAKNCYFKVLEIQPNFAEVWASLGNVFAQQQRWQDAINSYQKAVSLQPQIAEFYRKLANIFERIGATEQAAICSYKAVNLEPRGATAEQCLILGNTLLGQEKVDEAVACYRLAIQLNPKLSPAYHNIGEILSRKQEWEGAVNAYRHSIQVKPDNAGSHYGLAKALSAQEFWEEAVVSYRKVIQFNPNSAEVYHQLGDALTKLQKWEEAISVYRRAIELNPDNSWSYNNLGDTLIKLKRWEDAIAPYRYATQLNPNWAGTFYNLGEALAQCQHWEEAIVAYSRAVELNPELPGIESKLAGAFRERAILDLDAAFNWYHKAIKVNANEVETYHEFLEIKQKSPEIGLQLGNTLVNHNRLDEAINLYQTILHTFPENSELYLDLGKVFAQRNDWEGALTAYRRAIEIDPNYCWSHHELAEVLAAQGKRDEAISSYYRAIETNPSPSFWHYHNLAKVQSSKGEWEQAVVSYRKAIEINPDYSWSHRNLGDILAAQGKTDEATVCYRRAIKLKPRIF